MQGSGDDLPEIMFDNVDEERKPESEAMSLRSQRSQDEQKVREILYSMNCIY